jgi:hypothetical protein
MKSLIWIVLGAAAIFAGITVKNKSDLEAIQQELSGITALGNGSAQEIARMKALYEQSLAEYVPSSTLEASYQTSAGNITAEKKKIDELLQKWTETDLLRETAVKEVRALEATKPPATLAMAEGPPLTQFLLRSVPDEKTISVEHSGGLGKFSADKLTAEYKKRLGLGWKPEPPAGIDIDKEGKAVIKAATQTAEHQAVEDDLDKELKVTPPADTMTMAGTARAIAATETSLATAKEAMKAERANVKKLAMFKQNMASGGRTYAEQSKQANLRLIKLAGRVTTLQNQLTSLENKLKTFGK